MEESKSDLRRTTRREIFPKSDQIFTTSNQILTTSNQISQYFWSFWHEKRGLWGPLLLSTQIYYIFQKNPNFRNRAKTRKDQRLFQKLYKMKLFWSFYFHFDFSPFSRFWRKDQSKMLNVLWERGEKRLRLVKRDLKVR